MSLSCMYTEGTLVCSVQGAMRVEGPECGRRLAPERRHLAFMSLSSDAQLSAGLGRSSESLGEKCDRPIDRRPLCCHTTTPLTNTEIRIQAKCVEVTF